MTRNPLARGLLGGHGYAQADTRTERNGFIGRGVAGTVTSGVSESVTEPRSSAFLDAARSGCGVHGRVIS